MSSAWDALEADVALGSAIRTAGLDVQRRVAQAIGPMMPALAKALPQPWPERRAQPARQLPPPGHAAALPQRKAPARPEPDVDAVLRQTGAILSRIPDPRANRRRPVTAPAEVMRALDALATRLPPAPRAGDPEAADMQRRLAVALDGVLARALAAQRAGTITANDVAAIEVRVNLLRQRVRLSRAVEATRVGGTVAGLELQINAARRRGGLESL